jgi:hypothetical protein
MNRLLIEKIRKVYKERLLEALSEVDVVDKEGNVLISKDLKVIHKDSGYEYTVADILKKDDGVGIVLRDPEAPRVDPAPSSDILDELDHQLQRYVAHGDEENVDALDSGDLFIVDEESFAKEYEVK